MALATPVRKKRRRRRSRRRPLRTALVLASAMALSAAVITSVLWAWFRDVPRADTLASGAAAGAAARSAAAWPDGGSAVAPGGPAAGALLPQAATPPADRAQPGEQGPAPSAATAPAATAAVPEGMAAVATVGEAQLGMRLYPGASINAADSSYVVDPAAGEAAATSLVSRDSFAQVVAFYRAQLAQFRSAQVEIQEEPAGAGQMMMRAVDQATGANRTVTIVESGPQVIVTLSRWQPPSAPPVGSGG